MSECRYSRISWVLADHHGFVDDDPVGHLVAGEEVLDDVQEAEKIVFLVDGLDAHLHGRVRVQALDFLALEFDESPVGRVSAGKYLD